MNVFVCNTPFHCLVAERIIDEARIDRAVLVFLPERDTPKSRRYFDRLAARVERAYFCVIHRHALADLHGLALVALRIRADFGRGHVFYLGNPRKAHTRALLVALGWTEVYTFDDGLGNVAAHGYFHEGKERKAARLFFGLLDPALSFRNLRRAVRCHYTVFDGPNAFPNARRIALFLRAAGAGAPAGRPAVVLVTSPLAEKGLVDGEVERRAYREIARRFRVTHVLAHPHEEHDKIDEPGIEVLADDRIAEEIIADMAAHRPVTVVGMSSTALATVAGLAGARAINVAVAGIPWTRQKSLHRFLERLGVETCEIRLP